MEKLLLGQPRVGSTSYCFPRPTLAILTLASALLLSACGGSKDRDKPVQASSVAVSQGTVETPSSSASISSSSAESLASISSSLAVLSSSGVASSEMVAVSSAGVAVSSAAVAVSSVSAAVSSTSALVCTAIGGCGGGSSVSSLATVSQSSFSSLAIVSSSAPSSTSSQPEKKASLDNRNLRLLTREEYLNSVRDLFPSVTIDVSVMAHVPADPSYFNFASESSLALDNERTFGYQMAAEAIAKQVLASGNLWDLIHTCRQTDIECQVKLIGHTIFRRPLTVDEADRYEALYDAADAGKAVLQALLTSPHFLYRSEMGVETSPGSGVYRLDNYEIATLLSYSFWASTPDSQLLSAAAQENFDIKQQVKRMLADPRAERGLRRFVRGWLLVGNRGYSSAPGWALATTFDEETIRFAMEMIKADKPFNSLLKADYTYANAELALFYGSSPVSSGWAQSTFADGDSRRGTGILGHASFLAARGSDSDNPSPAQRGKFVREQLLCQKISGHGAIAVSPQPNETHRAAITRRTADPACSSCHQLINGIGFGFDRFGSNALYRIQEKLGNGQLQTIDNSGWIKGLDSAETQLDPLSREIAFTSVAELAGLIADSKLASACYSRQYYRYIVGRDEDAADESIIPLYSAKLRAGGGMLEMLTDLATHPSFILRR